MKFMSLGLLLVLVEIKIAILFSWHNQTGVIGVCACARGRVALEFRSAIFVNCDVYSRLKRFRIGLLMAKSL